MWEFSDYMVFVIGILGFLFPKQLILAIRTPEEEKAKEYQTKAYVCFGLLMFFAALFLNSI